MRVVQVKDITLQPEKTYSKADIRKRIQMRHSIRSRSQDRSYLSHRPSTDTPNLTIKCESITQKLFKALKGKQWPGDTDPKGALPKLNSEKICEKALQEQSPNRRRPSHTKKPSELLNLTPITIRFLNPKQRQPFCPHEKQYLNPALTLSKTIDTRQQIHSRKSQLMKGSSQSKFMRKRFKRFTGYNFANNDFPLEEIITHDPL